MLLRCMLLLPLGLFFLACGASKEEVREFEERIAQLEDENAQLRKGIVPTDTATAAVPVDPGGAPEWGGATGEPEAEVHEEPPPAELIEEDAVAPEPATEAPAPTPSPAASSGGPALKIYRAAVARDVADRAPVGEATSFPASVGKVYCYTEVGPAPGVGGTQLIHRWSLDGESQGDTRLKVGGDHWRTFSNRTVNEDKRGAWKIELVDERGNVLQTLDFVVE